jgi:DNA-binding NarL/FixJ family response regulator
MIGRPVRVLLADDHTLVRSGIRRILEGQPGVEVVAEAADGASAIDLLRTTAVDVAVLDLKMPGSERLDLVREAKAARPELRVIVLTMHDGPEYVARAVRGGADAYRSSSSSPGCCAPAPRHRAVRRSPNASAKCSPGWRAGCRAARSPRNSTSACGRWRRIAPT